jgi:predicted nucleic acid-binding protein
VIVLDTSILIEALSGAGPSAAALRRAIATGERTVLPTLVLYEWLRGPRIAQELTAQEALFPADESIPFGSEEARTAAELYRAVRRPRGREMDLAIAACALSWHAKLWTANKGDFEDIPHLELWAD